MIRRSAILIPALVLVAAACSSGSSNSSTPAGNSGQGASSSTTTAKPAPLQILLTNDDGVGAPGIDVVAQALSALDRVEVTIVAPATNQSGSGSSTTPGALTATDAVTASGMKATAVDGFPSDSVNYALDTMNVEPDVVVSGINEGQNLGTITEISGTVGAAKTAATRGLPAVAASQGRGDAPQYDVGATFVVAWIDAHRSQLARGDGVEGIVNINIPTCTSGEVRGIKQVPLAPDPVGAVDPAECDSTVTDVTTDIAAFLNGFVAVTQLSPDGATVTSSTTFPTAST